MNKKSIRTLSSLALAVAAASSGAYGAQLEEVIVTAQKRAESLQDVPISMTALSGKKIDEAGINSFAEMADYIPNLSISENAVATGIYMRGVGPGAQQSFEQSVGLYVDGVHMAKGRQIRTGMFDLGQVEVLRGPQGILFGKNTLAGAINVTSATPNVGDEFGGKISLKAESNNGETVEGHLSGSLTDNLAVRFAMKDRKGDGYLPNSFTGESSPTVDENMWRLSATWEPSDNTVVKFKHAQSEHERVGSTISLIQFQREDNVGAADAAMFALVPTVLPDFVAGVAAGNIDAYRDAISYGGCALEESLGRSSAVCDAGGEKPEGTFTETEDTSLNIDIELANGYTFTSVTGQAKYNYEDGIDADGMGIEFVGRSDISDYEQNSQEFRIASPTDGKFSFIAGAYWEEQTQKIDRVVAANGSLGFPAALTAIAGAPTILAFSPTQVAGINGINALLGTGAPAYAVGTPGETLWMAAGRVSYWEQETDAWAVFYQGTYNISDTLSVTAGLRYTEEDKAATAWTENSSTTTADNLIPGAGYNHPTAALGVPSDDPNLETLLVGLFGTWDHAFDDERSTDQLTPAISLEWKPSDTSMFYASYSEGFKSGGFNSVDDQKPIVTSVVVPGSGAAFGLDADITTDIVADRSAPDTGWTYEDETAKSFEIGGKHTLLDGSMNFNWALFTSEYVDQQVSTFVGLGFVVANAASSEIDGLELDMTWQMSDNLLVGANVAYLDAKYGSFPGAGCTAAQMSAIEGLGDLTPASPVVSAEGCTQQFSTDGADGVATGQTQDLSGGQLGAKYSGALFANYTYPLANGNVWYTGIDVNFSDGAFLTGDNDPTTYQDAAEKVNFRTGIRGDNWDLMLYGRNITDEMTASGAADVPLARGSHWVYVQEPEVWGARFTFNF